MKLTKDEISKYIVILFLTSLIPILFRFFPTIGGFFPNGPIYGDLLYLNRFTPFVSWICFFIGNIAAAIYINISEIRKNDVKTYKWQLFGLSLGFPGFLCYSLWSIIEAKNLFYQELE